MFDANTGRDSVAMLIAVREPLFDFSGPKPKEILAHAQAIAHVVRASWTSQEAHRAANFLKHTKADWFLAILEHSGTGAYATRTQQIRATYAFDGTRIGLLHSAGHKFEDQTVFQCVSI
ncbi:hypothetical protein [Celeribacter sp.]|uniref:hypothetical protein n=1 Tax=Celeribacter sp. TaxID=1890673 RepID=UPI003A9169E4